MNTKLPHGDIQGNILRGYTFTEVAHVFITVETHEDVGNCKRLLSQLLVQNRVTTAGTRPSNRAINVGISYQGLRKLLPAVAVLPQVEQRFPAFQAGMTARLSLLGDDAPPEQAEWDKRHVWLAVYAETKQELDRTLDELRAQWPALTTLSGSVMWRQADGIKYRVEHFGFRDDVSGAVIEGRPGDKSAVGNGKFDEARREWVPLATGEFILGYPNEQGVDVLEGLRPELATVFKNGTFAVFRDLAQDVMKFKAYVNAHAAQDRLLAARMIGRDERGRPLERPNATEEELNDFTYDNDPFGAKCPLGAHVRRSNRRVGGEHRILRRGTPYGKPFDEKAPDNERRGIYFVALNACIEQQFEFLQRTWLNGPPGDGSNGTDPIAASGTQQRRMVVEGDEHSGRKPLLLLDIPKFVTFRGGQYYFMPGIDGLAALCQPQPAEGGRSRPILPKVAQVTVAARLRLLEETVSAAWGEFMGLWPSIRWRLARVGRGNLYAQDFNALLGVRNVGKLRDALEKHMRVDQGPSRSYLGPYDVPGVQAVSWVLFQPLADNRTPSEDTASGPWVLAFSMIFDGEVDDVLEELACANLGKVLIHCLDFDASTGVAGYLKQRRLRSGFLFRDLGSLCAKPSPGSFDIDATGAEIREAGELEARFERFYAENRGLKDRAQSFLERFGDDALLVGLTRFERRVPDEARWIRRLSELSLGAQASVARQSASRRVHRGAHAKGHGLLEGTLRVVVALDPTCQVGLFAEPGREFDVRVRLSSGSPFIRSDRQPDARGCAIRVEVPGRSQADFLQLAGPNDHKQDFVLFSDPVFFASDVRQFTGVFGVLATRSKELLLGRLAALIVRERALAPLLLGLRVLARRAVNHPFAVEYHSATPYQLGRDLVVKYSVESPERDSLKRRARASRDDFLARALEGEPGDALKLDFFVHALPPSLSESQVKDLVEDATIDWQRHRARKVKVAELTLRLRNPSRRNDLTAAEWVEFDPWNCLVEHRPLGSLNRARLVAYRDSVRLRKIATGMASDVDPGMQPPWVNAAQ